VKSEPRERAVLDEGRRQAESGREKSRPARRRG